MIGPNTLIQAEDNWQTDMGAWFSGERVVFRGKDLFTELNDFSWFKLLMLGITGKEFDDNQIKLFEAIWVLATSYPEPRIWNNRVASLTGSARSTCVLATSAATAVSEAEIYGKQADLDAMHFLIQAKQAVEKGIELKRFVIDHLKTFRRIGGFGRPIINHDERIKPLLDKAKELQFTNGYFLNLALDIEAILLKSRFRQILNVGGLAAALMADQKITLDEYKDYSVLAFSIGNISCYIDASSQTEGSFFPLGCNRLDYLGPEKRNW
ncbi:MAG: hypothetical protein ACJAZI_000171 [Cycloclasticus sp.]|jgi:citrate synthase